jgi:hypothetical protein
MEPGILAEEPLEAPDAASRGIELAARIQAAFAAGGPSAAIHVVKSGMTAAEMQAVADGVAAIIDGGEGNGLIFQGDVEAVAPGSAKAKKAPEKAEAHDYASERHKSEEHKKR